MELAYIEDVPLGDNVPWKAIKIQLNLMEELQK